MKTFSQFLNEGNEDYDSVLKHVCRNKQIFLVLYKKFCQLYKIEFDEKMRLWDDTTHKPPIPCAHIYTYQAEIEGPNFDESDVFCITGHIKIEFFDKESRDNWIEKFNETFNSDEDMVCVTGADASTKSYKESYEYKSVNIFNLVSYMRRKGWKESLSEFLKDYRGLISGEDSGIL